MRHVYMYVHYKSRPQTLPTFAKKKKKRKESAEEDLVHLIQNNLYSVRVEYNSALSFHFLRVQGGSGVETIHYTMAHTQLVP